MPAFMRSIIIVMILGGSLLLTWIATHPDSDHGDLTLASFGCTGIAMAINIMLGEILEALGE